MAACRITEVWAGGDCWLDSGLQSKLLLEAGHLPGGSVSRSKVLHLGGLISSSPNFLCLMAAAILATPPTPRAALAAYPSLNSRGM